MKEICDPVVPKQRSNICQVSDITENLATPGNITADISAVGVDGSHSNTYTSPLSYISDMQEHRP